MLPEWLVVGFSGHRRLEKPALVAEGIRNALDRLAENHGPLAAISSAASGGDTLFLEEVARREMPYRLILPFPRARFEHDFTPEGWKRTLPLLDKAFIVEEASGSESDGEAYLETGTYATEQCDVMIFVWDGKPAAGVGGTADIVQFARATKNPLIIIDPGTGKISTTERLEQLAPKSDPAGGQGDPRQAVEEEFRRLDKIARKRAPQARYLLIVIVCLHLVATAAGIIALGFHAHISWWVTDLISSFKIVTLITAFLWLAFHHERARHHWMHSRGGAELCRSFLAAWNLRRQASIFPNMTISGFEPLARSLRIAWYMDQTTTCTLDEARRQYLKDRVQDQIGYFQDYGRKAKSMLKILKFVANAATFTAILCGVVALVTNHTGGGEEENLPYVIAKVLSLLLPLISAAIMSVIGAQEYSRRAIRYEEMVLKLREVATRLETVQTWPGLFRAVMDAENCLLQEGTEWHSFVRFAGEAA